jgi:hypothetical protein
MADYPNGELVPNLKRGFQLFNKDSLPAELRSSCLALVAQQEVHSNRTLSSASPSPNKKEFLSQVEYIQCHPVASKPDKHRIMGQLTEVYYASKHNLESSLFVAPITEEAIIRPVTSPFPSKPPPAVAMKGPINFEAKNRCQALPRLPSPWLESITVEHERLVDAMVALGPSSYQVKTYRANE